MQLLNFHLLALGQALVVVCIPILSTHWVHLSRALAWALSFGGHFHITEIALKIELEIIFINFQGFFSGGGGGYRLKDIN